MGLWSVIVPEAGANLVTNPSAETNATGWAAAGTSTIARSTAKSFYGAASFLCTYGDNANIGATSLTLTAVAHTVSAHIYVPSGFDGTLSLAAEGFPSATGTITKAVDVTLADQWQEVSFTFTPDAGDLAGSITMRIGTPPTAGQYVYLDGVQCEALGYATTYCDGDQPGCYWNGTPHASTSTRSAQSRAGGRVIDIDATYGTGTTGQTNFGMQNVSHNVNATALIPGAIYQSQKIGPRELTLTFYLSGTSLANLHSIRKDLYEAFKPELVTPEQPVILRYSGTGTDVEIRGRYIGGLDGSVTAASGFTEILQARFVCYDPWWYEVGEAAAVLTTTQALSNGNEIARRINGAWSDMSTGLSTGLGYANAMVVSTAREVYIGGGFTLGSTAYTNYITKWVPDSSAFSAITSSDAYLAGYQALGIRAMVRGPDGSIYMGGRFALTATTDSMHVVKYSPSASSWSNLSTGIPASAWALAVDRSGNLYVGTQAATGSTEPTSLFWKWNGSSWSAIGLGSGVVYALAVDSNNIVYIGGSFTSGQSYIAKYDGTTLSSVGTGVNDSVYGLAMGKDNTLYLTGAFTVAGGSTAQYIAKLTGNSLQPFPSGLSTSASTGNMVTILHNGDILTQAGTRFSTETASLYNGSVWTRPDFTLTSTASNTIVKALVEDIRGDDERLYMSFNQQGITTAYQNTVTTTATTKVYPRFVVKRSGGTSAKLRWLRNDTTSATIYADYDLLDGETVTIDFASGTVTSDYYGDIPQAVLPNSDFSSFYLAPGANKISVYVSQAGTPTITCYLLWKNAHKAADGSAA